MVDGCQHEGVTRLTVDDALEDVVALDADGHDHVFFGQCRLGCGQVRCCAELGPDPILWPCQRGERDAQRDLDVKIKSPMNVVIYVAEDVSLVRRLAQVLDEMGATCSCMKMKGVEQHLIVAEGALKIRQKFPAHGRRAFVVVMHVSLKQRLGHGLVRQGVRLQVASEYPSLVGMAGRYRPNLRPCLRTTQVCSCIHLSVDRVPGAVP